MSELIPFLNQVADAWAAALVRASWQAGLVLALVWMFCRALPKLPARWQCWLWRLAYLKIALALAGVHPIALPWLPPPGPPGPQSMAVAVEQSDAAIPPLLFTPLHVPARPATIPLKPASWFLLLWLAGGTLSGFRLLRQWNATASLRRQGRPCLDPDLQETCRRLSVELKLRSRPCLSVADSVPGPLLTGLLAPQIILPSHLAIQGPHLDLILAHELAHLKRHDLWWGWVPAIAKLLFFFHPLFWLAEREWRLAQEMACDAFALQATHAPVVDYAEMLLTLAGPIPLASSTSCNPATATVVATKKSFGRRLNAMRYLNASSGKKSAGAAALVLLFSAAAIIPWRLVAQAPSPGEADQVSATPPIAAATAEAQARQAEKLNAEQDVRQSIRFSDARENKLLAEIKATQAKLDYLETQLKKLNAGISATKDSARDPAVVRAELDRAQVDLHGAEMKLKRQQALDREQLVSREEVENAEQEFARARADFQIAQAGFDSAGRDAKRSNRFGGGASRAEGPKQAEQMELLKEEIKLAEEQVNYTRKQIEAGKGMPENVMAAQRELFGLRRELAGLQSNGGEIKSILEEEMKFVEHCLTESKKRIEAGSLPAGSEVAWKRELLKLKREMLSLE